MQRTIDDTPPLRRFRLLYGTGPLSHSFVSSTRRVSHGGTVFARSEASERLAVVQEWLDCSFQGERSEALARPILLNIVWAAMGMGVLVEREN
jgi:hypothetical protein